MALRNTKALVVGGTSGIGHHIALALAERGDIDVTIAGRSTERGSDIVQQMKLKSKSKSNTEQQHSSSSPPQFAFVPVNAFELESVKKLASDHGNNTDILIMTQGMATMQGYTPTVNGLDQKLQLHYFSRIYLAKLMAPQMVMMSPKQHRPDPASVSSPRIMTVLSAGVHNRYENYSQDFTLQDSYGIQNAADAAGFYSDAGFEALAQEYPTMTVCHAAPGFINTNWGTEFSFPLRMMVRALQAVGGKSAQVCGRTLTQGLFQLPSPPTVGSTAATTDDEAHHHSSSNFFRMDQHGHVIENNGKKHSTPEERDVIWAKTLEVLPDL